MLLAIWAVAAETKANAVKVVASIILCVGIIWTRENVNEGKSNHSSYLRAADRSALAA